MTRARCIALQIKNATINDHTTPKIISSAKLFVNYIIPIKMCFVEDANGKFVKRGIYSID